MNNPEDPSAGTRKRAVLARALHRARGLPRGSAEEVPPPRARARGAAALRLLRHLHGRREGRRAARSCEVRCTLRPRHARRRRARRPQGEGHASTGSRRRTRCRPRCASTRRSSRSRTRWTCPRAPTSPASSTRVRSRCSRARWVEPALAAAAPGERVQFERLGYFCVDPDSTAGAPVWNRTVTLRDSWAKIAAKKPVG